jgi:hypothetical protein
MWKNSEGDRDFVYTMKYTTKNIYNTMFLSALFTQKYYSLATLFIDKHVFAYNTF